MIPVPVHPANTPVTLLPGYTAVPAVPGSPGVVLAFSRPPWLCDAAPVPSIGLEAATAAAISGEPGYTVLDYLKDQFGPDVREVFDGVHFQ